jgi:hypothetical protein
VPSDFLFTFKVAHEITDIKFTNLPRSGERTGKPDQNFLNADLYAAAFVMPAGVHILCCLRLIG